MQDPVFPEFEGINNENKEVDFRLGEPVYRDSKTLTLAILFRPDKRGSIRAKSALRALKAMCDDLLDEINGVAGTRDKYGIRKLSAEKVLDNGPPTGL
ncbi:hypothetical protein [Mesorhizobium sp. DCY119]|uniref:hypothetical protein n=1 Tax=Mesorhizobium sp. DCY119 TaxID=2108445 RepID=UPI000E76D962|nr:hypothetical protein [Mesorhizobium sp. DCY119]RJG45464.1 hypothetical protein D3Y55_15170 [Mesorhizobium sp. DCY119]